MSLNLDMKPESMAITLNDLETKRFGAVCAKLNSNEPNLNNVNEQARIHNVSMLSTRVAVDDFPRIHELEKDGYQLMDTLVYYGRSLKSLSPPVELTQALSIRQATPQDEEGVCAVARLAFKDYFGHYHADTRLDNQAADEVYIQWAQTSVQDIHDKAPVLVAELDDKVVGFITIRLNSTTEGEVCLNAVSPDYQGKGIYNHLFVYALKTFKDLGAKRAIISTQINNYPVQKIWGRHGLSLEQAYYTLHKWMD